MDAAIETPRMDLVICSLVEFVRGCLGEEHPADMYRDLWGQHGPFYVPWDDELGSEEDNYDPGVVGRHEGEEELIAGVWLGERRSRAVFDDSQALAEYFSVSVIDEETRVSAKVALEPALVALPWYERDLARKLFGEAISAVLCERKRQQLRRKELAK
jgi:hypothetical protein